MIDSPEASTMKKHSMTGMVFALLGFAIMIQSSLNGPISDMLAPESMEGATNSQSNSTTVAIPGTDVSIKAKSGEAQFFVGILMALSLKLLSSIDDVVWLVPFLLVPNKETRFRNMMVYTWVCLFQSMFALAIASGGMAALDAMKGEDSTWSSEKIMSTVAGGSLLLYGCKLFYEWLYEEDEDGDEVDFDTLSQSGSFHEEDEDDIEEGEGSFEKRRVSDQAPKSMKLTKERSSSNSSSPPRGGFKKSANTQAGPGGGGGIKRTKTLVRETTVLQSAPGGSRKMYTEVTQEENPQKRQDKEGEAAATTTATELVNFSKPQKSIIRNTSSILDSATISIVKKPIDTIAAFANSSYQSSSSSRGNSRRISDSNSSSYRSVGNDDGDGLGPMPSSPPLSKRRSSSVHSETPYGVVTAPVQPHAKETHTTSALFVVAFLGSVDDLTLFVPMLVGQAIPWPALVLGSMTAVAIILMICIFLGMCKPVAKVLVSIPLFSIVLCFGSFLTIKSLTSD